MRKITLIVITAMFATGAFAQKFEWGVKAGLNIAAETNGKDDTGSRVGFNGGVFMEFLLTNNLGIQPELVYSMQGAVTEDGKNSVTDKFDYVNLPVMLKIYVWERRLSIDIGPQLGYMVSAKVKYDRDGKTSNVDVYDRIDSKFDVALGMGASIKFGKMFDAGLRYNLGMIKLVDGLDNRNGVFQFGVGLRF